MTQILFIFPDLSLHLCNYFKASPVVKTISKFYVFAPMASWKFFLRFTYNDLSSMETRPKSYGLLN